MDELTVESMPEGRRFTLNRPDSGNSLSPALVEAFHRALDAFEAARDRVLILQGAGRHFCTGFNLTDVAELTDGDLLHRFVRIEQLLARLWAAPYMTVAVAKGRVVGAGADIFAACSRRVAVGEATFAFPGASFGLVLGTRRLSCRIGESETQRLVAGGVTMDARTALTTGLATSHVEGDELPYVLDAEIAMAARLDGETLGSVRRAASSMDQRDLDGDLAALVRSAARSGLRERIMAYRAQARSAAATRASA